MTHGPATQPIARTHAFHIVLSKNPEGATAFFLWEETMKMCARKYALGVFRRRVLERGVRDGWLVKYGRDSYKRATFNGREQARADRARRAPGTRKLNDFDPEAGRA